MKIAIRPAIKLPQIIIHRKVAAYCRVSTQQEIQHHNLEAQRYCAYTGRDSNPQPSEPESDALSIEPPARATLL